MRKRVVSEKKKKKFFLLNLFEFCLMIFLFKKNRFLRKFLCDYIFIYNYIEFFPTNFSK